MRFSVLLTMVLLPVCGGCQQGPFGSSAAPPASSNTVPVGNLDARVQNLDQQASRLDSNNQDLHAQIAQSQRKVKLLTDELVMTKERLGDTARRLKEEQTARSELKSRSQAFQASSPRTGSATIRPNNSLSKSLRISDVAGLDVRQEQDVIRILIPADKFFRPQSVDYERDAELLAEQIGAAISRHYPRNRVVIESHVDSDLRLAGVSSHQLTASQVLAVFDLLVRRGQLPERQLALMALGANQPRASNGTEAGRKTNRRIELVVYPEEFD